MSHVNNIVEFTGINSALLWLLQQLSTRGTRPSPRGLSTTELLGVSIHISDPRHRIITLKERKWNYTFAIGELCWHLSGSRDAAAIAYYQPKWANYSEDGKIIRGSCYGYRIFTRNERGISQWDRIIECLKNDKDSRRAVLAIAEPLDSLSFDAVDLPCISSIQFVIRDNKLCCITYMRSNDAIWGFCYDVFFVTFLQELLARTLGIQLGWYKHICGSVHYYSRHEKMVRTLLSNPGENVDSYSEEMPRMDAIGQLGEFLDFESKVRTGAGNIENALNNLAPFWKELAQPLLRYADRKTRIGLSEVTKNPARQCPVLETDDL